MIFSLTNRVLPNEIVPLIIKVHSTNCNWKNGININCDCNSTVDRVENFKYLGMILDNNLNWNAHVSYICSKLRNANRILFNMRNCVSTSFLRIIYFALFESFIAYGLIVFCGTYFSRIRYIVN